ncbi:hypothetical protein [Sphaerisporangium fuscum]|uniref:hypothetical protein n=1 Tax=Sphaerisporangium fuscum TaxID=2835868 RepID=UPI001BDC2A88|nr:hypothetical protein [Sphaerisporangium fuscum]
MKQNVHSTPHRPARGRSPLSAAAASLVVLVSTVTPAAAADSGEAPVPEMPAAKAYDGSTPLPSVREVTKLCTNASRCTFTIDKSASSEYYDGVVALGNAIINCSMKDIDVDRTVTLEQSSTDNISGEISGQVSTDGTTDTTAEGTAEASHQDGKEDSSTHHTAPKDKGPNDEITKKNTSQDATKGTARGSNTVGTKISFMAAFKMAYSREWSDKNTEATSYKTRIAPNDMLWFVGKNAVTRVVGALRVGDTSKHVENVAAQGPSTVNRSFIFAMTSVVPAGLCGRITRPPGLRTTGTAAGTPSPDGLVDIGPARADWKAGKVVRLTPRSR